MLTRVIRQQIRQQFSAKRRALSVDEQLVAANKLCEQLLQNPHFQQSKNIGFYQAVRAEIDPQRLLKTALKQGKNCYLPVLHPENDRQLYFLAYHEGDKLNLNRYKILEPEFQLEKVIDLKQLDLVLVPLLAFDDFGNRLGSGAGFYDYSFSFLLGKQRPNKPYLLGLAYDWQRVDELAMEKWDVSLDAVATEKKIYEFGKN